MNPRSLDDEITRLVDEHARLGVKLMKVEREQQHLANQLEERLVRFFADRNIPLRSVTLPVQGGAVVFRPGAELRFVPDLSTATR